MHIHHSSIDGGFICASGLQQSTTLRTWTTEATLPACPPCPAPPALLMLLVHLLHLAPPQCPPCPALPALHPESKGTNPLQAKGLGAKAAPRPFAVLGDHAAFVVGTAAARVLLLLLTTSPNESGSGFVSSPLPSLSLSQEALGSPLWQPSNPAEPHEPHLVSSQKEPPQMPLRGSGAACSQYSEEAPAPAPESTLTCRCRGRARTAPGWACGRARPPAHR